MAFRTTELFLFIRERHAIYERRNKGAAKPWTTDPILQKHRFCNVYRELDKVTIWIRQQWRDPNQAEKDLWFAMAVARFFNAPQTLYNIGFPVPFCRAEMLHSLKYMKSEKLKIFNSAYIVSTNGRAMEKTEYVVNEVLWPLWERREFLRPVRGDNLEAFFTRLKKCNGFSNFMAGQVVADIKFTAPLLMASDWATFASSGPGSRRGLNRVYGYAVDDDWHEFTWYRKLMELKTEIDLSIHAAGMPALSAQDLQNCLCEFDKYERARLGQGRPKQRYDGEAK